jgi:hypothetical protein
MLCAVIVILGGALFAPGVTAYAQVCGCGETDVIVGDDEGNAIKGVTVEFLRGGRTLPNCGGDWSPAKQVGSGRKFKFRFRSYEVGLAEPAVVLRVSAPGYLAYEEGGRFMSGCYGKMEVVLRKKGQSYRTRHTAPDIKFEVQH